MTRHDITGAAIATSVEMRLAGLALVRIATGSGSEADVARDLLPLVPSRASPDIWRIELSRLLVALIAGGLVERRGETLEATSSGFSAAREFLATTRTLPPTWPQARDRALIALALGLEQAPAARQKLLAKADGLRALVVIRHFGLTLRGAPSPSRIRMALAIKALERAFGNSIRAGLGDKSSLPAKAGRLLAGQLSATPRDFGTDARLVAALAAEAVHATRPDLKSLQLAVLRSFFGGDSSAVRKVKPRRRRGPALKRADATSAALAPTSTATTAATANAPTADLPAAGRAASHAPEVPEIPAPEAISRPDPASFAGAVNAIASDIAEGWPGNRKAFVSRVWARVRQDHARWALTEIEFKCMLAESHRTGLIVLANADLKDKQAMKELQDSAVVYKNTVWHYVRVQD